MIYKTVIKLHDPVCCGILKKKIHLNLKPGPLQPPKLDGLHLCAYHLSWLPPMNNFRSKQPSEGTVLGQRGQLALAAQC